MYYNEQVDLNLLKPYFTRDELKCKGDGSFKLQSGFAAELLELRHEFNEPIIVTSCCRTVEYNQKLQQEGKEAANNSLHLIGNPLYGTDTCAIDVAYSDKTYAWRLCRLAMMFGWTVRLGKTFIHLDLRGKFTNLKPHIDAYW